MGITVNGYKWLKLFIRLRPEYVDHQPQLYRDQNMRLQSVTFQVGTRHKGGGHIQRGTQAAEKEEEEEGGRLVE